MGPSGSRDTIWYLQQAGLFEALREWDLRRLAEAATLHRYPRGQVILTGESDPELVYLVKEGRVKISTLSPDGKEQVLALLERGDLFGRLAPVDPRVPPWVEALEPSVICTIPPPVFEEIVRRAPEVGLQVIRVLAKRLRDAEREIADLSLRTVPARLAALLFRLPEEYGTACEDGIHLSLRLTHRDLAHIVGSSRETVTTILSEWRDQGVEAVGHRILIVRDPERLRKTASLE